MIPPKKHLIVSGLITILALFFYAPLKAQEGAIPATGTQVYAGLCTSVNQWFMTVGGLLLSGTTHSTVNDYSDCSQFVYDQQAQCVGGTIIPYQQLSTSLPWPGGQDNVRATINCPGFYTGDLLIGTATLDIENPITEYSCPPDYDLEGDMCIPNTPEPCTFDMPTFIAPSYLPQNTICVENPSLNNSCEYIATTESTGNNNGVTFTPTSESCGCDVLSATPCASVNDSIGTDNLDANNCTEIGGMNWCAADPEQRCDSPGEYTTCDTNCGYINDVFMCGDDTLPDASACISGDTRAICQNVPTGDCPEGYDCSGNNDYQNPTPCTANDTRAECQGVPEGGYPTTFNSTTINNTLNQTNNNTNRSAEALEKLTDDNYSISLPDLPDIEAAQQEFLGTIGTESQDIGELEGSINATKSFFTSFFNDLIPASSETCSAINITMLPDFPMNLDLCFFAPTLKSILAWIINISLAFYLFNALVNRTSPEVNTAGIYSAS